MNTTIAESPEGSDNLAKRVGYDVWLLVLTLLLCMGGILFVLTASAAHSWSLRDGDALIIVRNHVGRLLWGFVCMTVMALVDYHWLARFARPLWFTAFILLVAVLFFPQPKGVTAHRWIFLSGLSFQPAELAKYALVNYLALRFGSHRDDPFTYDSRKTYVGSLIVTMLTLALILMEPNLSMSLLVLGATGVLFFLSGIRMKPLLLIGSACLIPLSFIAWLTPYMRDRLTTYIQGIVDPVHAGYHVKQSLIGIGQGGLTGVGLGESTQKFFFLPKPYKDFIFSIVGEELGLIGGILVIAAFVFLLSRAWKIAYHAPDSFGRFLAAGITCAIGLSFIINVGVTLGVLPATGQPLPFISYGGSSLMMTLGAVGVLLNISRQMHSTDHPLSQMTLFR
jgi:cell division protein FtsW